MRKLPILSLAAATCAVTSFLACSHRAPAADAGASPPESKAVRNSLGMTLVPIPAGEFLMGSPEPQEANLNLFDRGAIWWKLLEGPRHKVKLTRPFHMGATEVTRGQWKAILGGAALAAASTQAAQVDDNLPIDNVGWDDCRIFLARLSAQEGRLYRLPTEAEWEYACRAGSSAKYCYGDDDAKLSEYAWHAKGEGNDPRAAARAFTLHPVALKKPNAWGLHDMHGNAWEWCSDRFAGSKAPYDGNDQTDPIGAVKDWGDRVMRGGAAFYNKPTTCSCACRNAYEGDYRMAMIGFRVVWDSSRAYQPATQPSAAAVAPWRERIAAPDEKARLEKLGAKFNKTGMVLMPIAAGEFTMGSAATKYEQPAHKVKITKPFYIGETEVTQAQWKAVTGKNPSFLQGDDLPVENVSWDECQEFLKKLSALEGNNYRLPTEAEWEYACRAGTTTAFFFGDDVAQLDDYAWLGRNSSTQTHAVAMKKPNAWGLYDTYGNVGEWCQDSYAAYEDKPATDPTGAAKPGQRVLRGGAWYDEPYRCRSAFRGSRPPASRVYFGLRVVMTP